MSAQVTVAGARYAQRLLFGNAVEPYPEFYVALIRKTRPTVFNTADELDEVDVLLDPTYKRVVIPNNTSYWVDSVTLARSNRLDLIFEPAQIDWGMLKYWAICTEPTGGDVFWFGTMPTLDVYALDRVVIPAGALALGFNVLYQGS